MQLPWAFEESAWCGSDPGSLKVCPERAERRAGPSSCPFAIRSNDPRLVTGGVARRNRPPLVPGAVPTPRCTRAPHQLGRLGVVTRQPPGTMSTSVLDPNGFDQDSADVFFARRSPTKSAPRSLRVVKATASSAATLSQDHEMVAFMDASGSLWAKQPSVGASTSWLTALRFRYRPKVPRTSSDRTQRRLASTRVKR